MQGLDLVRLLRHTANEYEQLVLRNRKLDEQIAELKRQYETDMEKINSKVDPLPHPLGAKVLEPATPSTRTDSFRRRFPDTMPVAALVGYSSRVYEALAANNVKCIGDFANLYVHDLHSTSNCGPVTIRDIEDLARRVGYPLA
jgi:hypothetical protein